MNTYEVTLEDVKTGEKVKVLIKAKSKGEARLKAESFVRPDIAVKLIQDAIDATDQGKA